MCNVSVVCQDYKKKYCKIFIGSLYSTINDLVYVLQCIMITVLVLCIDVYMPNIIILYYNVPVNV